MKLKKYIVIRPEIKIKVVAVNKQEAIEEYNDIFDEYTCNGELDNLIVKEINEKDGRKVKI